MAKRREGEGSGEEDGEEDEEAEEEALVLTPLPDLRHLNRVEDCVIRGRCASWSDERLAVVPGRPGSDDDQRASARLNRLADALIILSD